MSAKLFGPAAWYGYTRLMQQGSIFIISGTNRPISNTLRLARLLEAHYLHEGAPCELYSLADLPISLFSPDAFTNKPEEFLRLQDRVIRAVGLHLVIPEYNGSFPGILKHFIDMLKVPESFDEKPAAFVGLADGQWGGLRAVEQMQMVFGYRNAHIYPDRIFVPTVKNVLDEDGRLTDPELDQRFARQTRGFARFCGLFAA